MPFFSKTTPITPETALPRWGRVSLKPTLELNRAEWGILYSYFRDRELAEWNGASPIRMPQWFFRKIMRDEERSNERYGFGILDEHGRLIGSIELYDLRPFAPIPARIATLGIMIGERALWGQNYGREAIHAALQWAFVERKPALRHIRLTTFLHNERAQRSFAACGFREVGRTPRSDHTEVHMEITAEEWIKRFKQDR